LAKALVEEAAANGRYCRILVHRSRPDWLANTSCDISPVDIESETSLEDALSDCQVVVNLLRPDGSGRYVAVTRRVAAVLPRGGGARYLHASSIDVYGAAPERIVDEDTPPQPITPYEREHLEAEQAARAVPADIAVLRFGAIFGTAGRNLVSLAAEMRAAPYWKLALRRSLYGHRRLHLVGFDVAARALLHLAIHPQPLAGRRFLVTEDRDPDNEFAAVQNIFAAAYGRPSLRRVPLLPPAILRAALAVRARSDRDPQRRYSDAALAGVGFVPGRPLSTAVRMVADAWAADGRS
jgi:nucleoside-diphosphate-sugar epimerase